MLFSIIFIFGVEVSSMNIDDGVDREGAKIPLIV